MMSKIASRLVNINREALLELLVTKSIKLISANMGNVSTVPNRRPETIQKLGDLVKD